MIRSLSTDTYVPAWLTDLKWNDCLIDTTGLDHTLVGPYMGWTIHNRILFRRNVVWDTSDCQLSGGYNIYGWYILDSLALGVYWSVTYERTGFR